MNEFDEFNAVIEFSKFWECFDTKQLYITSSRKGVKSKCLDVYKKHVKDKQKADVVLFALVEHKKHYQKCIELGIETKGYHQGVAPWLNGKKWETELDDIEDLKALAVDDKSRPYVPRELAKCSVEGCQHQILGPKFKQCSEHIGASPRFKKKVVEWLKDKNLMKVKSESKEEWIIRLRAQCKNDINRLKERNSSI